MKKEPYTETTYEVVKYVNDAMWTIRQTTTVDCAKVYSRAEGEAIIKNMERVNGPC